MGRDRMRRARDRAGTNCKTEFFEDKRESSFFETTSEALLQEKRGWDVLKRKGGADAGLRGREDGQPGSSDPDLFQ